MSEREQEVTIEAKLVWDARHQRVKLMVSGTEAAWFNGSKWDTYGGTIHSGQAKRLYDEMAKPKRPEMLSEGQMHNIWVSAPSHRAVGAVRDAVLTRMREIEEWDRENAKPRTALKVQVEEIPGSAGYWFIAGTDSFPSRASAEKAARDAGCEVVE